MFQPSVIKVAILGPPRTGKSTLAEYLNLLELKRLGSRRIRLLVSEVDEVTSDLLFDLDFLIFTFDLTVAYAHEAGSLSAWKLVCDTIPSRDSFARVCVVGTKWDLIPQDPLQIALAFEDRARLLAIQAPSLKMLPVSGVTGAGCSDLALYIANAVRPFDQRFSFYTAICQQFDNLGTWLVDRLAEALSLSAPSDVNNPTSDPMELDDSTIDELTKTPEAHAWDAALVTDIDPSATSTCHKITPHLVVKSALFGDEYSAMAYVRSNTRIPVPQPRYPHLRKWLVMDFIEGTMLHNCWESQSLWMKLRIACTLRGYIKQLRLLKGARPGSVSDGYIEYHTLFDDQQLGPFTSARRFQVWSERIAHSGWVRCVQWRRSDNVEWDEAPYPIMGGDQWSLVFTHGDLNLSNIILSKDNVLWIVDWASGGFFPPWLETVGVKYSEPPATFARFVPFIYGSYSEYENFWTWFRDDVHRYPMPPLPRKTCQSYSS